MDLPEDFFDIASSHQQYIVYGDSVCEDMKTLVILNGVKQYISFDNVWNWLETQIKYTTLEEKEYINTENIDILIITYNQSSDCLEFKNPKQLVRHKINQKICRLKITNGHSLDVTNDHSLLHYNKSKLVKIKPKNAKYLISVQNHFDTFENCNQYHRMLLKISRYKLIIIIALMSSF